MKTSNQHIAQLFENIADLLQIKGDSIHRVLAYRNAGEVIRDLPRDLTAIHQEGKLTEVQGIGKTLAEKIEEILTTQNLEFWDRLTNEVPPSLLEILHINGVGPKKAKLFWQELDITTLAQLETAAQNGELQKLSGMGKKSEQKILDGIDALSRHQGRIPIGTALPIAQEILHDLLSLDVSQKGDIAGSLRRFSPTIGDVDILIASTDPRPIMERFVNRSDVDQILGHGEKKSSILLAQGVQVDLRVLPPERYGTGLSYFTGSQAHNVRLREIAKEQGLSLNEHAFSNLDSGEEVILCETEEQVYETLGLSWVAPELREDRGEIEAAQQKSLPVLLEQNQIVSDLHMHTTWSDGKLTILEMAQLAQSRGLKHIVITDHSRSLGVANGLSIERLRAQAEEVRKIDTEMGEGFRVLHGTEMDIKANGDLDYPDEVLAELDFVIASLHVSLRQDRNTITERLVKAIHNPHVDMIAHPRGQLIQQRDPADLDMDQVFDAAKQTNTILEINANPSRLDLDAIHARRAAEEGILISINTDSHQGEGFNVLPFGVGTARRAWLAAEQVINTWPTEQFLAWLAAKG